MAKKIIVKQHAEKEKEIPVEVLASEIVAISRGIRVLRAGRMKEKALLLLIQGACGTKSGRGHSPISQKTIRTVLDGISDLENQYIKPR